MNNRITHPSTPEIILFLLLAPFGPVSRFFLKALFYLALLAASVAFAVFVFGKCIEIKERSLVKTSGQHKHHRVLLKA